MYVLSSISNENYLCDADYELRSLPSEVQAKSHPTVVQGGVGGYGTPRWVFVMLQYNSPLVESL